MSALVYGLMALNICASLAFLLALWRGRRPNPAHSRFPLYLLACAPLLGFSLNMLGASGVVALHAFSPLRVCLGYAIAGCVMWSFVWWLYYR